MSTHVFFNLSRNILLNSPDNSKSQLQKFQLKSHYWEISIPCVQLQYHQKEKTEFCRNTDFPLTASTNLSMHLVVVGRRILLQEAQTSLPAKCTSPLSTVLTKVSQREQPSTHSTHCCLPHKLWNDSWLLPQTSCNAPGIVGASFPKRDDFFHAAVQELPRQQSSMTFHFSPGSEQSHCAELTSQARHRAARLFFPPF